MLSSTPPATLAGDLLATIVQALTATGTPAVQTLASTIGNLNGATQNGVINGLFDIRLAPVDLSALTNLTGVYTAFPTLTANRTGGHPGRRLRRYPHRHPHRSVMQASPLPLVVARTALAGLTVLLVLVLGAARWVPSAPRVWT
ncbi:hypothetical protein BH23ACT9_BH23ACT9_21800 [soil metagenome]